MAECIWSLEKGRHSFAIVVKHHTFIHLLWNSEFLNPKRHWNFKGEDFVGRISRMAHSISFGVSSTRVSSKLHQIQVVLPFPVDQEHGGTCVGQ